MHKTPHILVVEDLRIWTILFEMEVQKRKLDIKISWAYNGQEGVDRIASGQVYDLIIMNGKMPVMDGLVATSRIRKLGYKSPIIAWTAWSRDGIKQKFLKAGANVYVKREMDQTTFFKVLQETLGIDD